MRILFVTDSKKYPNVALMKFSAWAKIRGHVAGFNIPNPDYILVSCIFRKNVNQLMDGHRWITPTAQIIAGGPGYDPAEFLPREIERLPPDYSLYPKYKDSIGFVTAGCFRRCPFCIVPQQQPLHYVQHVSEFYQGGLCRILDDNILAMPEAFEETAKWLIENEITTRFEYLDIRLITEESAALLGQIKHKAHIHFSYDIKSKATESLIKRNVAILRENGIPASKLMFFIYIHSKNKENLNDAAHRWEFLRSLGVDVFGMCNSDNIHDYKFKKRVMRPGIWRNKTTRDVFGLANWKGAISSP